MTALDSVLWGLFAGSPLALQIFFYLVLFIALTSLFSQVVLTLSAARTRHSRMHLARHGHLDTANESEFLWVFLVAALNEEVTIADAVGRLRDVAATNKIILVANDGSEDRTGEILNEIGGPDLHVLTRVAPNARLGKAAALNNAYRLLTNEGLLAEKGFGDWDADHTILIIIDADGRLDSRAPAAIAPHFGNKRVGGAQCRVHIYNQSGYLTWAQDVEFSTFGLLFQAGRSGWGTANMGGNGQFNRLSALQSVADDIGPWRDRLTEDQDLGVRLIQSGWIGRQENSVGIHQQGLSSLRRLYRQRVRWAQGAWQATRLIRGVFKAPVGLVAMTDMIHYLLTPLLQLLTGFGLLAAVFQYLVSDDSFFSAAPGILMFFLSIGLLPGLIALMHRGRGFRGLLLVLAASGPYLVYSWMLIPVLTHSLLRQLFGFSSWAKTDREAIPQSDDEDAAEIEAGTETGTEL